MSEIRTGRGRGAGRQRGLATVEFAIGSLVMLMLMLISVEAGRAYYSYNTLTKAVRSGSRYLSTIALDPASVMDLSEAKLERTRRLVIGGDSGEGGEALLAGLATEDIHIEPAGPGRSAGRYVRVSATFDYRPVLGAVLGLGENHDFRFTMNATSVMRVVR